MSVPFKLPVFHEPEPRDGETTPQFVKRALAEVEARLRQELIGIVSFDEKDRIYATRDARVSAILLYEHSGGVPRQRSKQERLDAARATMFPDPFHHERGIGD